MLNRALLEDALEVSWVAENQDAAPTLADKHERAVTLAERKAMAKFDRGNVEPLQPHEEVELLELLKGLRNFRSSWTRASASDRLAAMKRAWPDEAAWLVDYTYEVIQRQNNVLLHGGPFGLVVAMLPGRRGPNRIGPDLRWLDALAHSVHGYYLICRVMAREFGFDLEPAMDAYYVATCVTKRLSPEQLEGVDGADPCPCESGRQAAECHLLA
jgi:hypothetical protein